MDQKVRVDGQEPDTRRERRTSGHFTAKSISIKDAKRRSGDCAQKTAEPTSGDLLRVAEATEVAERPSDRGAEVSRGHIQQRAYEVTQSAKLVRHSKAERRSQQDRLSRKR